MMANLQQQIAKMLQITLRKKHSVNLRQLFRETGSSSMHKIANRAYNAHADWLNHLYSPWKSRRL